MRRSRCPVALHLLARTPVPGVAKTRLIPALGARGAAAAHAELLDRSLCLGRQWVAGPAPGRVLNPVAWVAGSLAHPVWAQAAGWALRHQPEGDLGARIGAALAGQPADGHRLVIGSDCPALEVADLHQVVDALDQGAWLAFLPAEDGGYALIAVAASCPVSVWRAALHQMPWSEPGLMTATRAALRAQGLSPGGAGARWWEGRLLWDVDHPADWKRAQTAGWVGGPGPVISAEPR